MVRALFAEVRNFRRESENIEDEHGKPSMTLCRNRRSCMKPKCHNKFRLSSIVMKDKWTMLQKIVAAEAGAQAQEAL